MKKLLFVCSQNRLRSPTAEAVFAEHPRLEVRSAGLNADAPTPVSDELIDWADVIVAMEQSHKNKIRKRFKPQLVGKRVVVLGIPDEYEFMDPELVRLLKSLLPRFVQI